MTTTSNTTKTPTQRWTAVSAARVHAGPAP